MYVIHKAAKNLLRNKGRNLILLAMLFMVTLAAVVSLTIYNLTLMVKEETENYYAGEVSIEQNQSKDVGATPTIDDYKTYINREYVRSYVFYKSIPAMIDGIEVLDGDFEEPEINGMRRMMPANTHIYGMLDERSMDEFTYGERQIIEGRFPASSDEMMISNELAELNNLHIGDTLQLAVAVSGAELTLKISGLFSDTTVARSNNDFHAPQFNRRNDIIAHYSVFDQIPNEAMHDYKNFLLKDASDLQAFQNELYEKGLPTNLYLKADTNRYDEAVEGMNEMLMIVKRFFGIVAAIGIGIVFLLNVLALRERKYEIGVLRAIGMSKVKVASLLLNEMLILALLGAATALAAGIVVNTPAVGEMKRIILGGRLPSALMSDIMALRPSLSGLVAMEVIILSIGLVAIAGSMTIANITRFDPVNILSERS